MLQHRSSDPRSSELRSSGPVPGHRLKTSGPIRASTRSSNEPRSALRTRQRRGPAASTGVPTAERRVLLLQLLKALGGGSAACSRRWRRDKLGIRAVLFGLPPAHSLSSARAEAVASLSVTTGTAGSSGGIPMPSALRSSLLSSVSWTSALQRMVSAASAWEPQCVAVAALSVVRFGCAAQPQASPDRASSFCVARCFSRSAGLGRRFIPRLKRLL